MKRNKLYLVSAFILSACAFTGCQSDTESFDNKAYINADSKINTILVKGTVTQAERTIEIALAKPELQDVTLTYKIDASLVKQYNEAYYDHAVILPTDKYELPEPNVVIKAGSVRSAGTTVLFKAINELDRDLIYVLPVTIANANIGLLESARTTYFVFKGAALINVVADMEANNLHIDQWAKPEVVNNLSEITLEALIRARNYDRLISTVMGIEGSFLIRLGDAGFPSNQIQLATSRGNFPSADSNKGLPVNEWTHIAVTYNSHTSEIKIYVNGKLQSEGSKSLGTISLGKDGKDGFYIGRSYEDGRFLAGEFAECRIWNRALSAEEITAPTHFYEVDPKSEGLVAYWKCNEGVGSEIKDETGNGNNLKAKNPIKWTSVSLPAKN
ncbi:MAG: DUF1735 and LamG domain-containing protein [Bacteroides sp.]